MRIHDEDEWLGIYSTGKTQLLHMRENMLRWKEKARDLETFGERAMQLAMREEIQIHSFEKRREMAIPSPVKRKSAEMKMEL